MTGPSGAYFDLDGTVVASDIVRYGIEVRTADMPPARRAAWIAAFLPRVPWYLALDAFSRASFQRSFYRLYRGMAPAELDRRAEALLHDHVLPRLRPEAVARIERHRGRGHRVVLVTGSIEAIARPIADHLGVHDLLAPRLAARGGALTGELEDGPLAGPRKAEALVDHARRHGLDLGRSHAYGDSLDDVPMLERVGRAAVVNPDRRLRRAAVARGWEVLEWADPETA